MQGWEELKKKELSSTWITYNFRKNPQLWLQLPRKLEVKEGHGEISRWFTEW